MKHTIYGFVTIIFFFCTSCNKDSNFTEKNNNEKENKILVEDGILSFNSYEQFFSTLTSLSGLAPTDRIKWEEQLGFTSIKTLYENFNTQIDDIEASSKTQQQYNSKLSDLLIKYNGVVKQMPDGVYNINCNGLMCNRYYLI